MNKKEMDIELTNWKFAYISKLSEMFKDQEVLYNCEDYLPNTYEQTHVADWIHRIITKSQNSKYFAILKNNQLAGGINISLKQGLWKINAEISYFVAKEHRNKGVVTQAIKQTIEYVFNNYENIIRVFALTYEDNIASRKPLEKNNFIHENTLNNFLIKDEELKNCFIYSLMKSNYLNLNQSSI